MEIHVCGALDAADLVESIASTTGDDFELRTYERLTPLEVEATALASWRDVKKGDCVVTFSRDDIHLVRREIESAKKGLKCCVVYGQLPPETRAHQARLFNDAGSGYDVLVASDAIGMGLNLNIGRVLFRQILKFSGELGDDVHELQAAVAEQEMRRLIAEARCDELSAQVRLLEEKGLRLRLHPPAPPREPEQRSPGVTPAPPLRVLHTSGDYESGIRTPSAYMEPE